MTTEQHFSGREEIEKMYPFNTFSGATKEELLHAIFDEVIPEVLRRILPKCYQKGSEAKFYFYKMAQGDIKNKAKELYNIEI